MLTSLHSIKKSNQVIANIKGGPISSEARLEIADTVAKIIKGNTNDCVTLKKTKTKKLEIIEMP